MASNGLPLAGIFQEVARSLSENRQALNLADEANQDHGDNMIKTFEIIANSLQDKKNSSQSDALAYAAKQLNQNSTSGSGKLYAQGLEQAASQFKGKEIDTQSAMTFLQTIIGAGQPSQGDIPPQGGDVFTSILDSFTGDAQPQTDQQVAGGDLLSSLLGGLTGANSESKTDNQLDMGDLVHAGLAFMQSKQSGESNLQAIMQAVMTANGMGNSAHRTQSTQLVVNSFLKALGTVGQ